MADTNSPEVIEALDRLVNIKEEMQGLLIEANQIIVRIDRPIGKAAEPWMSKIEWALWGLEPPSMATTIEQLANGH